MALAPRKRWPRVVRPAAMPATESFSGRPSSTATIQRMGRMNRAPSRPVQVMERGQARSCTARQNGDQDLFSGSAELGLFGGKVFGLGRLCQITIARVDTLL